MEKTHMERNKIIEGIQYRQCSICEHWFILNDINFYVNTDRKYNKRHYHPYCKRCEINKQKKYQTQEGVKERHAKQVRKYEMKPEIKEKNKLRHQQLRKEGYLSNWQQNNPNKLREYNKKRESKNHRISNKEWISCKGYFNYECAYCGMPEELHKEKFKQQLHKEHVRHEGAGDLSNCVPACKLCNTSKHTEDMETWYKRQEFYTEDKLFKILRWIKEEYKNYEKAQ